MDTGQVTALTLLDLSASFDTIDYSVILDHLSYLYGISDGALTWIRSFLINRFQSITIRTYFSTALPLFCSVHQSSVLGPLLLHADDTQVYISLYIVDTDLSLKYIGVCHSDISCWMANDKLKLNANKTDFISIGTSRQRSKRTHFLPTNSFSHSILS